MKHKNVKIYDEQNILNNYTDSCVGRSSRHFIKLTQYLISASNNQCLQ
jgi:hypothetical protein